MKVKSRPEEWPTADLVRTEGGSFSVDSSGLAFRHWGYAKLPRTFLHAIRQDTLSDNINTTHAPTIWVISLQCSSGNFAFKIHAFFISTSNTNINSNKH